MVVKILAFYKFVDISRPNTMMKKMLQACKDIGLKGRILLGKEGINGSISGSEDQARIFKYYLLNQQEFSDIEFKEQRGLMHPFNRMIVKVKDEIIRIDREVDLSKKADYISPDQFLEIYGKEMENTVILDTRNDYEWKVGKFKNAVTLPIKTFRDFPGAVESLADLKDKKIVMYCTGGIRCEKASAYMVEQGFKDVKQLHGGILAFANKFPDTVWEGSCFVFDKRLVSDVNTDSIPISTCENCGCSCDLYRNCRNNSCDRYVILCPNCDMKMNGYCSDNCLKLYN